ncbi:MAG: PD-(D/E)XK nuclease family protein [Anaerolineae bacterium]|nr:PD-(D/E)XK nuclease family protein [Anaerolineae bacterium]
MSVHLYLAPAATGKTTYLTDWTRQASQGLPGLVRVCVPTRLQVWTWRHHLAEMGGSLGVRVETFDQLCADCLSAAGQAYTLLSEPVQYRLLQAIVENIQPDYYRSLIGRPGFIQMLQRLIGELKAARIHPETLAEAIVQLGNPLRLVELAAIYAAYQQRLQYHHWADWAGLGWLAVEVVESGQVIPALDSRPLVVDGFDNMTTVQLDLLRALARRAEPLLVAVTGMPNSSTRNLVHRRFNKTRERLEQALGVMAEPLPAPWIKHLPALAHLEARLFEPSPAKVTGSGTLSLVELPNRVAEVREALRWLKVRLVQDGLRPSEFALLARDIIPYRPFILQIGAEFGLPLRLIGGQPLPTNPAVAALLDLLRLMLPTAPERPEPALPRRLVVEAWASPYFDWSAGPEAVGILPGEATALAEVARQSRVIGGLSQWREALAALAAQTETGKDLEEELLASDAGLTPTRIIQLLAKFERFVQQLTPPAGATTYREFVGWLEDLIGPDPFISARRPQAEVDEPAGLNMVTCIRANPATTGRDLAALQVLKEVLHSLVWAEEVIANDQPVDFYRFFTDLAGVIEAASYNLPPDPAGNEILVAEVTQARGLSFQAVAVLGLAEGEFPARLAEDPLLPDADRLCLQRLGLPLNLALESAEIEFFYETLTRAREQLLLTRPRLSDNGALWPPSPYWEEVRKLVEVEVDVQTSESAPAPDRVASWPELLESLISRPGYTPVWAWVKQVQPERAAGLAAAAHLFNQRFSTATCPYDGHLADLATELATAYGPDHTWSASRLESYRTCPLMFFVGAVLGLEPRAEPSEGLDVRQLGFIYHKILEKLYRSVPDPTNLEQLQAALPGIAGPIFNEAPQQLGFRATAWWQQTQAEIIKNVELSLIGLAALPGNFTPSAFEAWFDQVRISHPADAADFFYLHGVIDRIDLAPDGSVRIIDYKTGGASAFTNKAVTDGKKLQLPLYALAAQEGLTLGSPVDGFYWHIQQAKASTFNLASFEDDTGQTGPAAALSLVQTKAWEAVQGVRQGAFSPQPPTGGCPSYCSAATFCWHYRPGFGG